MNGQVQSIFQKHILIPLVDDLDVGYKGIQR